MPAAVLALSLLSGGCDRGPGEPRDPAGGGAVEGVGVPESAATERRFALIELGGRAGDDGARADVIGLHISADRLRSSLALIPEAQWPHVLILCVDSLGGALREVAPLADLIAQLQERGRVVVWVRQAWSAAALVALAAEERYMTSDAVIGGAVTVVRSRDSDSAVTGEDLATALKVGEEVARRGGVEPLVVRAMQTPTPLSVDVAADGRLSWRMDLLGARIVNPAGEVLALTSRDAAELGVSRGTADDLEELLRLIDQTERGSDGQELGAVRWVRVGQAAADDQRACRDRMAAALERVVVLLPHVEMAMQHAAAAPDAQERDRQIARVRALLEEARRLVQESPAIGLYTACTPDWLNARDAELRAVASVRSPADSGEGASPDAREK